MAIGLVGKKSGMTRIFTEAGESVPVTVLDVAPNHNTHLKTVDSDGYTAIQVTTGGVKQNRVSKPEAGHFAKSSVPAGRGLWEFRVDELPEEMTAGGEMTLDQFLFVRPTYGAAQYALPLDGLYLCGAGTHPGGGISGAAGRNCALEIIRQEGKA